MTKLSANEFEGRKERRITRRANGPEEGNLVVKEQTYTNPQGKAERHDPEGIEHPKLYSYMVPTK